MASRRNYVSITELAAYSPDLTITDNAATNELLNKAEELIDKYVGYQERFWSGEIMGKASAAGATSITLEARHQNVYQQDYFAGCVAEIIGGTGAGQIQRVTASTLAGVLTTDTFTTPPDTTSIYRISQLGKFPRIKDVYFDSQNTPNRYYKNIVEDVRRAVCAQYEYMSRMGVNFFSTNKGDKQSERIGDYSYSMRDGATSQYIAPKAKEYLKYIKNRTGQMV